MDFKNLDDIIAFAIAREEEAAAFYRQVAERENLLDKKQLFRDFADEEDKHARLLERLQSGDTPQVPADYDWKWIVDIKRSNYVDDLDYHPGMSYRDILLLAAQREEKALAFYNECLQGAENEAAKSLFKMLCQEEAKHKQALEGLLDDFMAEMGD